MIKAVIFDMGGVILRTIDPSKREKMAQRFGTTRRELEKALFLSSTSLQSEIGQLSDEEHWRTVLEQYGQPADSYPQAYREFFSGDAVDEDLINFIASLKKDYKIGLLSNAWMNARANLYMLHNFLDIFDVSIFSAEVGMRKPDERIFQLILKRLQVAAQEAVFVDDFQENIAGAAALGIHTVHFRDREQAVAEVNQLLTR